MRERVEIVADIGGTNARFAAVSRDEGKIGLKFQGRYNCAAYQSFEAVLADWTATLPAPPTHALFALAGPVAGERVRLTNLPWPQIDGATLRSGSALDQCVMVNDFHAMARAVPVYGEDAFVPVRAGTADETAPVVVIGPGTGLGIALLCPRVDGSWHIVSGEGGHQAYAPRSQREREIAAALEARFGYVSNERVAAGIGLADLQTALCDVEGAPRVILSAPHLIAAAKAGDAFAAEICALRAGAVLSAAGDMVLMAGARGGVVLTGGVSPYLLDWFRSDAALDRFSERGPKTDFMTDIPIRMLSEPDAALVGAAALLQD